MKKAIKSVLIVIGLGIIAALGYGVYFLDGAMPIGTGHSAKYICSKVFLADQDAEKLFEVELKPYHFLFAYIDTQVDDKLRTVTSKGFGFWSPTTAVYRPGIGCTLTTKTTRQELLVQAKGILPPRKPNQNLIWPDGEAVDFDSMPATVNRAKLNGVLEDYLKEPGPNTRRNTHAMVVVYKKQIVAEKYADNITAATPLLGWSMTKSWTNALVGILVKNRKLDIYQPAPVKAWQSPDDPRGKITLDQLMRMSSGLEFEERYLPFADATYMFYERNSMAEYAAGKPLQFEPDTKWSYSSGTTNIIARIIRDHVGGTLADVHNFAREGLFDKLGMHSALIEPDPSGSFVGSSYGFATARDWARFGLLMKNDGVWKGERILPEGWVKYSTTPTPQAPKGQYGAQFWLNAGAKDNPADKIFRTLPNDLYYMGGFNGQIVAVIPSWDLVIVRLGVTLDNSWSREDFIVQVLECIGSSQSGNG